jgi:hypothetical protein
VRAVWVEADTGLPAHLPLPPSLTVETSPGKFQLLWRVEGLSFEQFDSITGRLVKDFGSDPNAADRSRVLRLPDFESPWSTNLSNIPAW